MSNPLPRVHIKNTNLKEPFLIFWMGWYLEFVKEKEYKKLGIPSTCFQTPFRLFTNTVTWNNQKYNEDCVPRVPLQLEASYNDFSISLSYNFV